MSLWLTLCLTNLTNLNSEHGRLNLYIISGAVTEEATINLEGKASN